MNVELDFLCDVCGTPVEDGYGSLYVRFAALQDYREQNAAWEKTHGSSTALDLASVLSMPTPAPWLIHHDTCAPADNDGYHIGVEQVRTWRLLVSWTAHLMEKNWLPSTTWRALLDAAANGRDQRIAEHVRGDAA